MKCPICKRELSYADTIDGGFEILTCDCKRAIWFFGNDKIWQELARSRELVKKLREKNRILTNSLSEYFNRWIDANIETIKLRDKVKHYQEQEQATHQAIIDEIKGV